MTPPTSPRPQSLPTDLRVTFLGIGQMASSVLAGSLAAGLDADRVCVTARSEQRVAAAHRRFGVRGTTVNTDGVADATLVVVAVPPESVAGVLEEVAGSLRPDAVVVSFAGGITLEDLAAHLPASQPVVRAMPNVNAEVGQGVVAITHGPASPAPARQLAEAFLALASHVLEVPEHLQPAVGALSGSGPAHAFYVLDAMAEAGVQLGLSREVSLELAARTLAGSAALALQTGEHPALLRERVCSPGGSTVTAIGELDDRGVRGAISAAISGRNRH